jgi:hypothetical protein
MTPVAHVPMPAPPSTPEAKLVAALAQTGGIDDRERE